MLAKKSKQRRRTNNKKRSKGSSKQSVNRSTAIATSTFIYTGDGAQANGDGGGYDSGNFNEGHIGNGNGNDGDGNGDGGNGGGPSLDNPFRYVEDEVADNAWIYRCLEHVHRSPKMALKNEDELLGYFIENPVPDLTVPERVYKSDHPEKYPRRQQVNRFVRATENNLRDTRVENDKLGALLKEPCVFEHLCLLVTVMREPFTRWHLEIMVDHVLTVSERLTRKAVGKLPLDFKKVNMINKMWFTKPLTYQAAI